MLKCQYIRYVLAEHTLRRMLLKYFSRLMVKWRELELLVAADRCVSVCTTQSPILFYIRRTFFKRDIFHGNNECLR